MPVATILFMYSGPRDQPRLSSGKERRAIEKRILMAGPERIQIRDGAEVGADDISGLLMRIRPDVIHFSGHGDKMGHLVLTSANDSSEPIRVEGLAESIRNLRCPVRLAVLNACHTAADIEALVDVVDCVIAMATSIEDSFAIIFASTLYEALTCGQSVQVAYGLACARLKMDAQADSIVPVLRCRRGVHADNVRIISPLLFHRVDEESRDEGRLPFPFLAPYAEGDNFSGRSAEVDIFCSSLRGSQQIHCLYGCSGVGKSSFLSAGVCPRLRSSGQRVELYRDHSIDSVIESIAQHEQQAWRHAMSPKVLIFDQFERLLSGNPPEHVRSLGSIIRRSIEQRAENSFPRWVLSYRDEAHGRVLRWLRELVLPDDPASTLASCRSRDPALVGEFPLAPLGSGNSKPEEVFRDVIRAPLHVVGALRQEEDRSYSADKAEERWRILDDDLNRLAAQFGQLRLKDSDSPLVPDLQVVLQYLIKNAVAENTKLLHVPPNVEELVEDAVEKHLVRSFSSVFPTESVQAAELRTSGFELLRLLSTADGRCREPVSVRDVLDVVGDCAITVLSRFSEPLSRLIVIGTFSGNLGVRLPHDSLALVVQRLASSARAHSVLALSEAVLKLRTLVGWRVLAFQNSDLSAAEVDRRTFREIQGLKQWLPTGAGFDMWYEAVCRAQTRRFRRTLAAGSALIGVIVIAAVIVTHSWIRSRRRLAMELAVREGRTGNVLECLHVLRTQFGASGSELWGLWIAHGPRRFQETLAIPHVLPMEHKELMLFVLRSSVGQREWFHYVGIVLNFFSQAGDQNPSRQELLGLLRQRGRRAEAMEVASRFRVSVPRRVYELGCYANRGERFCQTDEAMRRVRCSRFWMSRHEVTEAEYARMDPLFHAARPEFPMVNVSWFEAYAYAAWVGADVPTEEEWEVAARAEERVRETWSGSDGTDLGEYAWYEENSGYELHPVGQRRRNRLGLFDMHGNAIEWTASAHHRVPSPFHGSDVWLNLDRIVRGGSFKLGRIACRSAKRGHQTPMARFDSVGFRLVWREHSESACVSENAR